MIVLQLGKLRPSKGLGRSSPARCPGVRGQLGLSPEPWPAWAPLHALAGGQLEVSLALSHIWSVREATQSA